MTDSDSSLEQFLPGDLFGPPYTGRSGNGNPPAGCNKQVKAASRGVNLSALERQQRCRFVPFQDLPSATPTAGCGCQVAENGCIDSHQCGIGHFLHPCPILSRWYGEVWTRIHGLTYLDGWSGWAAPSVVKLLGFYPSANEILRVWLKTSVKVRHDNKVVVKEVGADSIGLPIFSLIRAGSNDSSFLKFSKALAQLPSGARVGAIH